MEKTLYIPFIQSSRGSACLPSSRHLLFHLLSLLILYCILCIFLNIFSVFGIWRWLRKRFVWNFYGFVRSTFFPIYIIYIIDICNNLHQTNKASTMRSNSLKMFDKYILLCSLSEYHSRWMKLYLEFFSQTLVIRISLWDLFKYEALTKAKLISFTFYQFFNYTSTWLMFSYV